MQLEKQIRTLNAEVLAGMEEKSKRSFKSQPHYSVRESQKDASVISRNKNSDINRISRGASSIVNGGYGSAMASIGAHII